MDVALCLTYATKKEPVPQEDPGIGKVRAWHMNRLEIADATQNWTAKLRMARSEKMLFLLL